MKVAGRPFWVPYQEWLWSPAVEFERACARCCKGAAHRESAARTVDERRGLDQAHSSRSETPAASTSIGHRNGKEEQAEPRRRQRSGHEPPPCDSAESECGYGAVATPALSPPNDLTGDAAHDVMREPEQVHARLGRPALVGEPRLHLEMMAVKGAGRGRIDIRFGDGDRLAGGEAGRVDGRSNCIASHRRRRLRSAESAMVKLPTRRLTENVTHRGHERFGAAVVEHVPGPFEPGQRPVRQPLRQRAPLANIIDDQVGRSREHLNRRLHGIHVDVAVEPLRMHAEKVLAIGNAPRRIQDQLPGIIAFPIFRGLLRPEHDPMMRLQQEPIERRADDGCPHRTQHRQSPRREQRVLHRPEFRKGERRYKDKACHLRWELLGVGERR